MTDEFCVRQLAHDALLSHNRTVTIMDCHCDHYIMTRAALTGLDRKRPHFERPNGGR